MNVARGSVEDISSPGGAWIHNHCASQYLALPAGIPFLEGEADEALPRLERAIGMLSSAPSVAGYQLGRCGSHELHARRRDGALCHLPLFAGDERVARLEETLVRRFRRDVKCLNLWSARRPAGPQQFLYVAIWSAR